MLLDLIRSNQRLPLSDAYSKNLRDIVDKMLNIDISQRISTKEVYQFLKSSSERAYLDELLAKKGKQLASIIYRGSVDGFMLVDFHSRCDGAGPTVSLFKVKKNQHWIGGYTTV
jgi:serine/threonine protein kinase